MDVLLGAYRQMEMARPAGPRFGYLRAARTSSGVMASPLLPQEFLM